MKADELLADQSRWHRKMVATDGRWRRRWWGATKGPWRDPFKGLLIWLSTTQFVLAYPSGELRTRFFSHASEHNPKICKSSINNML